MQTAGPWTGVLHPWHLALGAPLAVCGKKIGSAGPGSWCIPSYRTTTGWWFGCHDFYFPRNIGFLIIPIDEVIFFRGVAQPPTRQWNIYVSYVLNPYRHMVLFVRLVITPDRACMQNVWSNEGAFLSREISKLLGANVARWFHYMKKSIWMKGQFFFVDTRGISGGYNGINYFRNKGGLSLGHQTWHPRVKETNRGMLRW